MEFARHFRVISEGVVQCILCPHKCILKHGERGECGVRKNINGNLFTENYGKISALHLDPIEKKPLYHFYPGSKILSIGSIGCNLSCSFCQNSEISQSTLDDFTGLTNFSTNDISRMALQYNENIGIAFTYNEPTVSFEFNIDTARLAKQAGLKVVVVSNGYISEQPLGELIPYTDAFNIDLKAFHQQFYKKMTGGTLKPVLNTLKKIADSGRHLEITNLVIPGLNDEPEPFRDMAIWIKEYLGEFTVLHISRYHPAYKMKLHSTPAETLHLFYRMARQYLHFVYLGNLHAGPGNDTFCPVCNHVMIKREGYVIKNVGVNQDGSCRTCGFPSFKHFKFYIHENP
jgi:pyruvate formate lyase activating enzyme